jgi:hypothetical protein
MQLLLADEITTALDVTIQMQILGHCCIWLEIVVGRQQSGAATLQRADRTTQSNQP